ncbi:MAG TPA: thioredoxin family protein [Ornithinimicrobium sp.]|nr:thioredoxin family protein [Ornithinimicrobium sp.]
MIVKVLGPGCRNCHRLEERTREALARLGLQADVRTITDYGEIAAYGVLRTPGLVVDDELVHSGSVPTTGHLVDLLGGRPS